MATEFYSIPENPQYDDKIRRIKNDDPVNAETIVNPIIEAIMRNTAAVKKQVDDQVGDISSLLDTINGEVV